MRPLWLICMLLLVTACPLSTSEPEPERARFIGEKQEDRIDCRRESRTVAACSSIHSCKVLMAEEYNDCMLSRGYAVDSITDHMTDKPPRGAARD